MSIPDIPSCPGALDLLFSWALYTVCSSIMTLNSSLISLSLVVLYSASATRRVLCKFWAKSAAKMSYIFLAFVIVQSVRDVSLRQILCSSYVGFQCTLSDTIKFAMNKIKFLLRIFWFNLILKDFGSLIVGASYCFPDRSCLIFQLLPLQDSLSTAWAARTSLLDEKFIVYSSSPQLYDTQ